MTSAPKVVLLILSWNRRADVLRCVASLTRLTYPNYLPVVIDNASIDGTAAELRARYPDLLIIQNPCNLGYAGGNNVSRAGAQAALELDRLLIAQAFYNPVNEGQTATFSNYFPSDGVLMYYAPMAASREVPSFLYSFRWTAPELGEPFAAIRHAFDTRARVDGVEVQYYQDERVTGSDYGALLLGVGSAQANGLV